MVRKVSCFPLMLESQYFYPPYQASMMIATPSYLPQISGRESRASGCRHLLKCAVGTGNRQNCWNKEKLGWDVWVAWIALSGPLRDRSILHQVYRYYIKAEEHLACDHDLNISLYVSGKGTEKCLMLGVGVLGSILDGYVSLASGNLFLILLRHKQFSQYKLSYFPLRR